MARDSRILEGAATRMSSVGVILARTINVAASTTHNQLGRSHL